MTLSHKTLRYITLFWQYIKYVITRFFKDYCFESASALTYTTLLSLVPFLAVSVFILKGIPYFQDLWMDTQQYIFSHFIPATGREVQKYLHEFVKNTGQLTMLGISFLFVSAMILIFTIEQTFNRIWGVKSSRGFLSSFILYWAVLTFLPILMGLSFGVSSYLWSLPMWQDTATKLGIVNSILIIIPFLLTWLSFTLIYILIPNCPVDRKHAIFGAFIVSILFEISKRLFASYVAGINLNALLYGAFATIPLFLLWIYISWVIILLGAQMVNAMEHYQFAAPRGSEWRFLQAYKWLAILWEAQQTGKELSAKELFYKEGKLTSSEPFKQLEVLEKNKWIKKTASNKYILARDLSAVTFYDFFKSVPWKLPTIDMLLENHHLHCELLMSHVRQFDRELSNKMQTPLVKMFHQN